MTEKDIALAGEAGGGGGGGDSNVNKMAAFTDDKLKISPNINLNLNLKRDLEDEFLSTSPDSANGDTHGPQNITTTTNTATANGTVTATTTANTTAATEKHNNNNANNKINIYHCADSEKCVTLQNILDYFKSPLSEEQAWALIYQFISLYRRQTHSTSSSPSSTIFHDSEIPTKFEHFNLHSDGTVHFSSSWSKQQKQRQNRKVQQQQQQEQQQQENYDIQESHAMHEELQHKDEDIHSTTNNVIERAFDNHSTLTASHRKIIRNIAVIVYTALDYNLQADEQCQTTQALEDLITYMTADDTDDDCIDEGIDEGDKRWDDENDYERINQTKELDYILETCKNHVKPTVPEDHYKAVCRALVTETIELRIFLQQVLNNGAEKLHLQADTQTSQQELAKLGFNDWARFWVQVIDELRRGVRLKKSNYERAPIEYELTPYEILMEDIRSKKYQLRKVMVNGDIPPRVKKDAHAVILEFIRSRPPLKKASERKLPPPIKRTPSPREQLMDSIRKGQTLKHITPPALPRLKDRLLPASMTTSANAALPSTSAAGAAPADGLGAPNTRSNQRLIKVDFSLLQDDDHFFDECSGGSSSSTRQTTTSSAAHKSGVCSQPKMPPYPIGGYMVAKDNQQTHGTTTQAALAAPMRNTRRTTYDLATQCESRRASLRRHTIVGCQSNFDETNSMPTSRPESRQSQTNDLAEERGRGAGAMTAATSNAKEQHNNYNHEQQQRLKRAKSPIGSVPNVISAAAAAAAANKNNNEQNCSRSTSSLGPWNKSFLDKKTWMERGDDRLSLTLEEIVHIRSVMTKAELEGLPVGVRVKEDVEKRKVCFLCLRTRFTLFSWGIQCKLCQRTVCSKCYTKMRIPSEHFRNVPLVLISPSLLSSPASSSTPSPSHHAAYMHASSTGNITDDAFPKTLIERLLRSESERKTRNSVGSAPSSPKHQRSNMSTPGNLATTSAAAAASAAAVAAAHAQAHAAAGQAVEALHDDESNMSASYCAGGTAVVKPSPQLAAAKQNYNLMSRSMEGPRSLPVHSPARPLSSSSTLDRKSRFSRGFTLSASGSHLAQEQKENMRGEQVPVCHDCQGLVNEITSSAKQKRSSARNRTLQNLTLDLSPVWK